ncbi:MAG: hypothetical protein ACRD3J_11545, partial [Thermoanaerobaculia bacterium]
MEATDHATQLGKVVAHLLNLEFLLRVYLYERVEMLKDQKFPYGVPIESLKVGDSVPKNAITSFDSLGQLIQKYNAHIATESPGLVVSKDLVALRDAIAHGRVSAVVESEHLHLVKFSDPRRGPLVVAVSEELNPSWFEHRIRWTRDEVMKVGRALGAW